MTYSVGKIRQAAYLLLLCAGIACNTIEETEAQRQDRLFKKDYRQVVAEVDSMLQKDQRIRYAAMFGNPDALYRDSISRRYQARGLDIDSVLLINDTFLVGKAYRDSMDLETMKQDELHTKRLIALVRKYGYPESDRVDTSLKISPFLLFHHPSLKYKDTILNLLSTELALGRMDTVSYEMIRWDMNGREGLPDIKGMKVQHNSDGTTSITL